MKTASRNRRVLFPVLLAAMLPLAAQATEPSKGTIETEISAELASGTQVTFTAVPAGMILPLRLRKIRASGTTAQNIVALW